MKPKTLFIHPNAIVEPGAIIGDKTRIWAFAHILPGASIGDDCNICDSVFIENDVQIGNRVTIKCGVQIWDGVKIDDDVFVGPNATFTNDPFPRSKQYLKEFEQTIIHRGASIGANATVLPGIIVGAHAMIGAGAVVTRDVPTNAIVVGNPARIHGYVSTCDHDVIHDQKITEEITTLSVSGARLIKLPKLVDLRGSLSFGEVDQHLPFTPIRFFIIYDVPSIEVRGEHAHRTLHQFLICLHGSCTVVLDNGKNREGVILNRPDFGLHIPPLIWAVQYKYSRDAILLVLASDIYKSEDYIRDYEAFIKEINKT